MGNLTVNVNNYLPKKGAKKGEKTELFRILNMKFYIC
jgi:hypothetical protein